MVPTKAFGAPTKGFDASKMLPFLSRLTQPMAQGLVLDAALAAFESLQEEGGYVNWLVPPPMSHKLSNVPVGTKGLETAALSGRFL